MPPSNETKVLDSITKLTIQLATMQDRLVSIDEKHDQFIALMAERFHESSRKIQDLSDLITGNGTPERGLLIRIDRLESKAAPITQLEVAVDRLQEIEKRRAWLIRALTVAVLACMASIIAEFFHH